MKIAVIGSGGREHALIKSLRKSEGVTAIYALPGNGGMEADAVCVPIAATDIAGVRDFCLREGIDFAVVAPDDPLVLGMADELRAAGIPAFGPGRAAARIEGSKVFAKELMKKYGIPTAGYEVFDNAATAYAYVRSCPLPVVLKADGLALGKGVLIATERAEAEAAVRTLMEDKKFGRSGERIVVEEFLQGPEVSVLSFTDGKTLVPMVSSMDHKRALDGDMGLNTGGMGTVAPNPYYTEAIAERCMDEIFLPTIRAMAQEGCPFTGCLYFGLMLTADGPRVIEYNCRFGDPETQVVLPLLETDLLAIMQACGEGRLDKVDVRFKAESACCVIAASGGYPEAYEKGFPISGLERCAQVFVAGAEHRDGGLVSAGGRVLGVVGTAANLEAAVRLAYEDMEKVHFEHMHYRRDIGARALEALAAGEKAQEPAAQTKEKEFAAQTQEKEPAAQIKEK